MNTDGKTDTSPLELATPSNLIGNPTENNSGKSKNKDKNIINDKSENLEEKLKDLINFSPKYNTRSKNITEHTQLTFDRKPKTKMPNSNTEVKPEVSIKLDEAIKLIPECTGENDICQFINACDLAIKTVEKDSAHILITYITTKLKGEAYEAIKYKDKSKWSLIKKYLEDAFGSQYSASSLQLQINSIKQNQGETVKSYTNRLQQLYYKLISIYTFNKPKVECEIIEKQLKEQTLVLYIKGFIKPIKAMLKARNPKTLEEAKNIAMGEELEFNSEKETNNLINYNRRQNNNTYTNHANNNYNNRNAYQPNPNNNFNNRNNRPIKCYKCDGPHFANQCRVNQVQRSNFRPPNNYNRNNNNYNQTNNNQGNNFTRPPTNYNNNTQGISCNYCNRRGHNISDCYKKKNDERNNSGNDRTDAARGPRTVHQIIQTAEEEETYDVASTSYQQ